MRKDFIISKIESSQDGSPYIYVTFYDPNDPKATSKADPQSPFGGSGEAIPFTSPEDLMKICPKPYLISLVEPEECRVILLPLKLV